MDAILKRLIQARKAAGLSQGQAAQMVGFSSGATISHYESGIHLRRRGASAHPRSAQSCWITEGEVKIERHITGVKFVYDTDNPLSPASQEFLRYADQHVWSENANITHAARGTGERLRRTGSGFDPSRLIDCTGKTRYNPPRPVCVTTDSLLKRCPPAEMAWQRVPRSYEERHDVALFYWETGSEGEVDGMLLRGFCRRVDE